jgi:glycosyltransferase involved in cell wall biosynthesis
MASTLLPISAVIPTRNRAAVLQRALHSLLQQSALPQEIIVIDASDDASTLNALDTIRPLLSQDVCLQYLKAEVPGAAIQRNQGCAVASREAIWFFDDDITLEADCLARLWQALQSDPRMGGVNASITNQRYHPPGRTSRVLFALMNGGPEPTYAGRVLGPAVNLLPEDRADLPEVVPSEWLNTTCTLYRSAALPKPPFDSIFTGYSLMEDLTLSLRVGRTWRLANARTARIFHDSQPGDHKSDPVALSRMELVNRHYVMTRVLGRTGIMDYAKLAAWEAFQLLACAAHGQTRHRFLAEVRGKIRAMREIIAGRHVASH